MLLSTPEHILDLMKMCCEPSTRETSRNILGLALILLQVETTAAASGIAAVDSNLIFVAIGRVETNTEPFRQSSTSPCLLDPRYFKAIEGTSWC
jgi:hypothetical protein